MDTAIKFKSVDQYFSSLPPTAKSILQTVRTTVKLAAPHAEEVISYNMPAIKTNGVLVYYAARENHIGFYPTAAPIQAFKDELSPYKYSKGAIQFPIGEPMPLDLISRIVKFRLLQDEDKAKGKR